jgi:type I restriction enzyme R subunit
MCLDLFTRLLVSDRERGPHQKRIIFCARDRHADDVAVAMNNLYAQWCASKGVTRRDSYGFSCTTAASGNDALPDFRGSASSHFIATRVELPTTKRKLTARAISGACSRYLAASSVRLVLA